MNYSRCRRCDPQSVQRVVRGLDAALLECVVVLGSLYSESCVDLNAAMLEHVVVEIGVGSLVA